LIVSIILLILISLFLLTYYLKDYNTAIKNNWRMSLPKGHRKELIATNSESSFLGDGHRYHIFIYKEEPKQDNFDNYKSTKDISVETEVQKILNSLDINQQNRPDFSKEYYWYMKNGASDPRDKLYLISLALHEN
jgi:hypothetical protein